MQENQTNIKVINASETQRRLHRANNNIYIRAMIRKRQYKQTFTQPSKCTPHLAVTVAEIVNRHKAGLPFGLTQKERLYGHKGSPFIPELAEVAIKMKQNEAEIRKLLNERKLEVAKAKAAMLEAKKNDMIEKEIAKREEAKKKTEDRASD